IEHLGRMIDAPPGDIGDVQEAVDAAQIDERTVIGDVLDHAVDDLTLLEVLHQLLALLGAGLLEDRAARHHDISAPAIDLQALEGLRLVHQRRDVADRPDVALRARQERDRAVEIDSEAALDLVEDDALHLLVTIERLLELAPALLTARLVAREHRLAKRVLDTFEIDLHRIANLEVALAARPGELPQRHTTLGLGADVDDREILLDPDDLSLDDGPFLQAALGKRLLQQLGEILSRWCSGTDGSHGYSR